ncbi:MAG: hypothetical protein ACSHWS_10945 [Sulfitobacter sp.]
MQKTEYSTIFRAQVKRQRLLPYLYWFLQISPTYRLAHDASVGSLPKGAQFPNDFDRVYEVYQNFGDVWQTSMEDWWFHRARHHLDSSIKPEPSLIKRQQGLAISSLTQTDTEHLREFNDLYEKFGEFWASDYANQLFPDLAVLAVPLSGNKQDMQKLVRQLIDDAFEQVEKPRPAAKYVMRKTKMELRTFKILLYAVRIQAQLKSNDENSKLSQLDKEITKKFREKPKSGRDGEVQTSGRLLTALRIAEWAARMDFPKQTKLDKIAFVDGADERVPIAEVDLSKIIQPVASKFSWAFIAEQISKGNIPAP